MDHPPYNLYIYYFFFHYLIIHHLSCHRPSISHQPSSTNHHPPIRHPCCPSVIHVLHRRWSIRHHPSTSIGHHPSSTIRFPEFIIGHESSIIPHASFGRRLSSHTHGLPIEHPRIIRPPLPSASTLQRAPTSSGA